MAFATSTPPSAHIELGAALAQLPGSAGERSVALFQHGTLLVNLYAPGRDPQTPHTRKRRTVIPFARDTVAPLR